MHHFRRGECCVCHPTYFHVVHVRKLSSRKRHHECVTRGSQDLCCQGATSAGSVHLRICLCLCAILQTAPCCAGCVTTSNITFNFLSSQTVLLQHQSGEEFLSKLQDPGTTVVVSISPQSRSALAGGFRRVALPPHCTAQRRGTLAEQGIPPPFPFSSTHASTLL